MVVLTIAKVCGEAASIINKQVSLLLNYKADFIFPPRFNLTRSESELTFACPDTLMRPYQKVGHY